MSPFVNVLNCVPPTVLYYWAVLEQIKQFVDGIIEQSTSNLINEGKENLLLNQTEENSINTGSGDLKIGKNLSGDFYNICSWKTVQEKIITDPLISNS